MKKSFFEILSFDQNSVLTNIQNSLPISLGPRGSSVIFFQNNSDIRFLHNGSDIMNSLDFSNLEEKLLEKSFQYLSKKTQLNSGEASLSVCLFFAHLISSSNIFLLSGYNPIILAKGFQKTSFFVSNLVFEKSISIRKKSEIKGIIQTSLGEKIDKKFTCFLLNAFQKIKREAFIQIDENINSESELKEIKGIEVEKGFLSSYFINDFSNFQVSYENALLLISTSFLKDLKQIQSIIDFSILQKLPLIIITESISKDLLSILILNYLKKKLKVVVIKYSSIQSLKTALLEDLALMTQANYVESTFIKGKIVEKDYNVNDLGLIHKVIICKDRSQFIFSKFSKVLIKRRLNELNRQLLISETDYEKNLYENRISRLSGNLIKLKISKDKLFNVYEIKKKIENLILNLRSSLEEGYLSGGSSFYIFTSKQVQHWSSFNLVGEEIYSSQILINSLEKLSFDFLKNLKKNQTIIFQNLLKMSYPNTYDLIKEEYVNGLNSKIFDSSKSIRLLFLHSISLLSTLITMYYD